MWLSLLEHLRIGFPLRRVQPEAPLCSSVRFAIIFVNKMFIVDGAIERVFVWCSELRASPAPQEFPLINSSTDLVLWVFFNWENL